MAAPKYTPLEIDLNVQRMAPWLYQPRDRELDIYAAIDAFRQDEQKSRIAQEQRDLEEFGQGVVERKKKGEQISEEQQLRELEDLYLGAGDAANAMTVQKNRAALADKEDAKRLKELSTALSISKIDPEAGKRYYDSSEADDLYGQIDFSKAAKKEAAARTPTSGHVIFVNPLTGVTRTLHPSVANFNEVADQWAKQNFFAKLTEAQVKEIRAEERRKQKDAEKKAKAEAPGPLQRLANNIMPQPRVAPTPDGGVIVMKKRTPTPIPTPVPGRR